MFSTMKIIAVCMLILIISACSTMQPPRYSFSMENQEVLKTYKDAKFYISDFQQSAEFASNCRLMGPIEPADGLTIAEFISRAFNHEAKMADIFSNTGVSISGNIDKILFSSISGITRGYWDISITLVSSNGQSLSINNVYKFKSGFDAITACNATADALTPAIQDLIYESINDPGFALLLE